MKFNLSDSKPAGQGCLTLFALPFAIVGLVVLWFTVKPLLDTWQARGWPQSPATIERVELVSHAGDDGSSYQVEAAYSYVVDGQTYQGHQVSADATADSDYEGNRRIADQLQAHVGRAGSWRARVDPDNPRNALLVTDIRWGKLGMMALLGLLFAGVGIGLMIAARRSARGQASERQLAQDFPDKPWLWRRQWRSGVLHPDGGAELVMLGLFVLVWNAISLPAVLAFEKEWSSGNLWMLLVLLFPLIGIGMVVYWLRKWRHYRRFGKLRLRLKPMPGRVGGELAGDIELHGELPQGASVVLTLSVSNRQVRGSGKNKSTNESLLWEQQQDARVSRIGLERAIIPLRFNIPEGLPASSWMNFRDQLVWRLRVRAALAGVDLDTQFELPVFPPEDAEEAYVADGLPSLQALRAADAGAGGSNVADPQTGSATAGGLSGLASMLQAASDGTLMKKIAAMQQATGQVTAPVMDAGTLDAQLQAEKLQRRDVDGGGVELLFPAGRFRMLAFMLMLGPGALLIGVWVADGIPLFIRLVMLPFMLLFVWLGLLQWVQSHRLRAWPGRLEVERRRFGSPRIDRYGVADADNLKVVPGMAVNGKQYYRIKIQRADELNGRAIGTAIGSKFLADSIVALLRESMLRQGLDQQ